ncbi:uncharacterized protein [Antedon mediterranea]|uniref:uncharacterized protein n=1 Tax=Antedon mediterranea TaxID=105859 RepID=UPI003AF574A5
MLSGIASFLFGTTDGDEVLNAQQMDLTEADDEWVLVDVTNVRRSPRISRDSSPSKENQGSKGGNTADAIPIPVEESWFMTPPPCFNAGSPGHIATSPMENLLIEHPSMSVYHSSSSREAHCRVGNSRQPIRKHKLRARTVHQPKKAAAIANRLGIEQSHSAAVVHARNIEKKQFSKSLSRSKVERANKAYHQESNGKRRHYRNNKPGRHTNAVYKQC